MKETARPAIELWPVEKPVAYARNARVIPDQAIGKVAASIKEFGFKNPILVDGEGVIIAGHTRLLAAQRLGLGEVPVVVCDDLTDAQVKAYRLADNRTAQESTWDYELLNIELGDLSTLDIDLSLTGFDPDELAGLPLNVGAGSEVVEDEAPEPPAEPVTKTGDLWLLGGHRVLCGDATDAACYVLLMQGNKAECVWTDPPYGVDIGAKNRYLNSIAPSNRVEDDMHNDSLNDDELAAMLRAAFAGAATASLAGAAWYVAAPPGPLHVLFGAELKALGIWHQTIQWVKNNATFSPMGVDYHWQAEPIFYGWVPGAAHRYYGGRKQTTVWEIDRPTASPEHPSMKPVALVARSVENSSRMGELVLDPFLGSGTTLIAAEQTGRICYGLELAPRYCDVIVTRWQNFTGREATLEGDGRTFARVSEERLGS